MRGFSTTDSHGDAQWNYGCYRAVDCEPAVLFRRSESNLLSEGTAMCRIISLLAFVVSDVGDKDGHCG
jgi:hypothetical protein